MNELGQELLVTAIRRDKTMNPNWSSFLWGTADAWQSLHPISDVAVTTDRLKQLLAGSLSEKEIASLLAQK